MVARRRSIVGPCFFMWALLLLSGCSSSSDSIFNPFRLDDGNSVGTDSKQRLVLNTSPKATPRPGLVQPQRIVCAEPSPDVATTVANSISGGFSLFGRGSASFSKSQAEGLIQLAERTVTVQLLRDQMYRACEAYANGAITGTTYSLITSKNNKTMVSLMLGEIAGGGVGRSLGALGGKSGGEARAAMQGVLKNSDEARKAADDLRQAEAELQEVEALPDEDQTKSGKLEVARQKRDAAAQKLQNSAMAMSNSIAEVGIINAGGGITVKASPELARVLKGIQREFLDSDALEDFISTCLVELGLNSDLGPYFDPINVVFRTKHLDYERQLDNTSGRREEAREALDTTLIRLNDSYLSRLCKRELPDILKDRMNWRMQETKGEYSTRIARELRKGLNALGEALEKCGTLNEDDDTKKKCRNVVISLGEQYQLRLEQDSAGKGEDNASKLFQLYSEIQKVERLVVVDLMASWEVVNLMKAKVDAERGLEANIGEERDREELRAMKAQFEARYNALSKAREEMMTDSGDKGLRMLGREVLELAGRQAEMPKAQERMNVLRRKVRVLRAKYDELKRDFEDLVQHGQLYVGAHEHIRAMAGQRKSS